MDFVSNLLILLVEYIVFGAAAIRAACVPGYRLRESMNAIGK
jgi:hypothetical protein